MNDKLLTYFNNDTLASGAWLSKYALEGEVTPDDMHMRMAIKFGEIEKSYEEKEFNLTLEQKNKLSYYGRTREYLTENSIFNFFKDFKYIIPQGSIMSQLGSKSIGSLSNCFIIGSPVDSYSGILKTDQEQVQLMKRRGGVGFDISELRPDGAETSNAAKSSTGAISFMNRFSNSCREVAQNGRRGALMLSISILHPDVMDFITIKRDLSKVTGANISIRLTDEFMKAVKNEDNHDFLLKYPINENFDNINIDELEYDKLVETTKGKFIRKVNAKIYWDEIIKSARDVAEPGLMFWDNMINNAPDGLYPEYRAVSTNPCGEIPMGPYDACRLIATNLYSFVDNPFTNNASFNYEKFYKINYEAQRLSDDLIDLELNAISKIIAKITLDPEDDETKRTELNLWLKIQKTAISTRRTGLGFTALGDMLAALNLKYDSDEAFDVVKKLMYVKMESELDCTIDLAIIRGSFSGYSVETENQGNEFFDFIKSEYPTQYKRMKENGRRNISWSTLAPTGTTSLMSQTTSGIEPIFMAFYTRRKKINPTDTNTRIDFIDEQGDKWQEFPVLHNKLVEWYMIKNNISNLSESLSILENKTKDEINTIFEQSPWYKSTANDIDWVKRVKIQSIIQRYITHSISSTINLPKTVSYDEVSTIYLESWLSGLKGVTVYRDGSRNGVLVSSDKSNELVKFHENNAPKRPKSLKAKLIRFNNNKEKWIAIIGLYDNKPYEIFTGLLDELNIPQKIETGNIVKTNINGIKGYDFVYDGGIVNNIAKVFNEDFWNYGKMISSVLRHGMPIKSVIDMFESLSFQEDHITSWKAGVLRSLKKFHKGKSDKICEDCGGTNIHLEEGCEKCLDCGSSKCG